MWIQGVVLTVIVLDLGIGHGGGPLQALLAPEPVHPLVVYRPAFSPQQAVGHAPAPADVLSCDLAETMPQLGLLKIDDLADMALAAAGLAHQAADPPLGCPVTLLQDSDGPPATLPPLPGKMTPLHPDHFLTRGLDGAIRCVVTARPSKLM